MLKLAEVNENDLVYDLGSGDGRIPISAAKDFGARAIGIEIDPKLVWRANENARKAGVLDRVHFRNEDLFEADIGDATVVTLFLSAEANLRLPVRRIERERRRLLKLLARQVYHIASSFNVVGEDLPGNRMDICAEPQKTAK